MIEFYEALRRRAPNFLFEDHRPSSMHRFPRSEDRPSMGWVDPEDPGLDSFDGAGWLVEDVRIMVGQRDANDDVQRAAYADVLSSFAEAGMRADWSLVIGEPIWLRRSDDGSGFMPASHASATVAPDRSAAEITALAHQQGISPAALALGGLERAFFCAQPPMPVE